MIDQEPTAAVLARHFKTWDEGGEDTPYCDDDKQAWPCDAHQLGVALEERVTFDEELQRRMDAVRPLQARLDAAEAREQRLRASLAIYDPTHPLLATERPSDD